VFFCIKNIKFRDGERYPLLLDEKGIPHWNITLYITTKIRNSNKASNTISAILSSLKVLLCWSYSIGIDLEDRFSQKKFLTDQELESLRNYLQVKKARSNSFDLNVNIINFKKRSYRSLSSVTDKTKRVSLITQYIRMSYIADYLSWLAIRVIEQNAKFVDSESLKRIELMKKNFCSYRPINRNRSRENSRKGLSKEQQNLLFTYITPSADKNPFSFQLQCRNYVIISLLYHLGLRAGEVLALKISDFDFSNNTVLVARRHDNPDDPRNHQPVVKTIDRRIPLSNELAELVSNYIIHDRRNIKQARKHDYLLVTHIIGPYEGKPLSLKGLNKVFLILKKALPDEFDNFSPHVLRHTANDRFSELMDKNKIDSAKEEKMRSYLMGWKEGSGTASMYTRRHIETKSKEAAIKLQKYTKNMLEEKYE
tara:strand:- start:1212 stop:2483 length:1272 start_codon:yes stop_codon:yes gene_type:complete